MNAKKNHSEITALENEFDWVQSVIKNRLNHYFHGEEELKDISAIKAPEISKENSTYNDFVLKITLASKNALFWYWLLFLMFFPIILMI